MLSRPLPARTVAIALSASLHLAVGLALFMAATSGRRISGPIAGSGGRMMTVRLAAPSHDDAGALAETPASQSVSRPSVIAPMRLAARSVGLKPVVAGASEGSPGAAATTGASNATAAASSAEATDLPDAEVLAFRARLQAHLSRYRLYPVAAQTSGAQGVVRLHFTMDRQGQVLDAWIETTSGAAEIDREAIAAVRRAQPLPPPPAEWPAQIDITLPVLYRLD